MASDSHKLISEKAPGKFEPEINEVEFIKIE